MRSIGRPLLEQPPHDAQHGIGLARVDDEHALVDAPVEAPVGDRDAPQVGERDGAAGSPRAGEENGGERRDGGDQDATPGAVVACASRRALARAG
jgi:hypothetical protein